MIPTAPHFLCLRALCNGGWSPDPSLLLIVSRICCECITRHNSGRRQPCLQLLWTLKEAFCSKAHSANSEQYYTSGSSGALTAYLACHFFADVALRAASIHQAAMSSIDTDGEQSLTAFYGTLFEILESLSNKSSTDDIQHDRIRDLGAYISGSIDWAAVDESIAIHCAGLNGQSIVQLHSSCLNKFPSPAVIEQFALLDLNCDSAALNFDRRASLKFLLKYFQEGSSSSCPTTKRDRKNTKANIEFLQAKVQGIRNKYIFEKATAQQSSKNPQQGQRFSLSEQAFAELLDQLEIM